MLESGHVSVMSPGVIVADVPVIQEYVRAVLESRGYRVETPSPEQVGRLLQWAHPDLLITNRPQDYAGFDPEVRILYVSTVPDRDVVRELPNRAVQTLMKPFNPQELMLAVNRLLTPRPDSSAQVRFRHSGASLILRPGLSTMRARGERARKRATALGLALAAAGARRNLLFWRASRCWADLLSVSEVPR